MTCGCPIRRSNRDSTFLISMLVPGKHRRGARRGRRVLRHRTVRQHRQAQLPRQTGLATEPCPIAIASDRRTRHEPASSADSTCEVVVESITCQSTVLPDLDPLVLVQPEGVGFCYVEGGVELGEVPDDLVAAELGGGVWVGRHALQQHLGTYLGLPDRTPAQEQPLLRRIAVQLRLGIALVGDLVRLEGDREPTKITNVLADGQLDR